MTTPTDPRAVRAARNIISTAQTFGMQNMEAMAATIAAEYAALVEAARYAVEVTAGSCCCDLMPYRPERGESGEIRCAWCALRDALEGGE